MICDKCQALYEEVGDLVREARIFAKVRRTDEALLCRALGVDHTRQNMSNVGRPIRIADAGSRPLPGVAR